MDEKEIELSWREMGAIEDAIKALRASEWAPKGQITTGAGATIMWDGTGPITIRYPADRQLP